MERRAQFIAGLVTNALGDYTYSSVGYLLAWRCLSACLALPLGEIFGKDARDYHSQLVRDATTSHVIRSSVLS